LIYHRHPAVRWRCMEAGDGVAGGGLGWPARDGRRRGGPA
jgi:hypothetical protein